jgi:sialate O-acetylesterase
MKRNLSILILLFLFAANANAEIKLPAIFGDNMVLQQQTDAAIWGMAKANTTVKVTTSWNNENYSTKANSNGDWKLKVKTPSAGGPYSIKISDDSTITLKNVLIGEVWVCSGQSNMHMPMSGYRNQPVLGSNEAIATSTNNSIRLITIKLDKKLERQTNFSGEWKMCTPGNVSNFSATAYFFGRMIQKALGVPVGLISSSWGGTQIEPWMSENGINNFDWINLPDKSSKEDFSKQTPTVLFNAMIAPMVGFAIQGTLWYQGESNRNEPRRYNKLMPKLIENWRNEWNIGNFSLLLRKQYKLSTFTRSTTKRIHRNR